MNTQRNCPNRRDGSNGSESYAPGFGSSASGSRLGCRVKRDLNSMAKPVSTLRWTGSLTTFFFFSSSGWTEENREREEVNRNRTPLPSVILFTEQSVESTGSLYWLNSFHNRVLLRLSLSVIYSLFNLNSLKTCFHCVIFGF